MQINDIIPNVILRDPIFPKPVKVLTTIPMGESLKIIGEGMQSEKIHQPVLKEDQLGQMQISSEEKQFDEDPKKNIV